MSLRKVKTTKKQISKPTVSARKAAPAVKARLGVSKSTPMFLVQGSQKTRIPEDKVELVLNLIEDKSNKDEIITTQEAADLLNVSRPYLVKLIDVENKLNAFYVGTQRRLYRKDVLAYKRVMRNNQMQALADITKEAEDLELDF